MNLSELSTQEIKLLRILQTDSQQSSQDIARKAGISPATCWRKVKALEESGVITGYAAHLDRKKLGFEICALVHVSIERRYSHVLDRIQSALQQRPEILECYATTGDADFTLKVLATSMEHYDQFLQKFLMELPEVGQVRSSIVLREISNTSRLPL